MSRLLVSIGLGSLIVWSAPSQTTRRVPQDYGTIQAAVNAAANFDTVLVDHGTYFENIRYLGKKIVIASRFVLDGDTAHLSATIINGSRPRHTDSASVVTFDVGTDTNSVLCGLTITGGEGNRRYDPAQNVICELGAGVDVFGAGGKIIHNRIVENTLTGGTGGSAGINAWDIYTASENSKYLVIENNLIARNRVNGTYAEGGALGLGMSGRVSGNRIVDNSAMGADNAYGGGISIWGNAVVSVTNNLIARNSVSHQAGAMVIYAFKGRTPAVTLVNNTICFNSAGQGNEGLSGGIRINMVNNIIWNPGDGPELIAMGVFGARYNIIRGGYYDANNYDEDPLFADSVEYRLLPSSPAVGRGAVSVVISDKTVVAPAVDINGRPRPSAAGTNPDCGATESMASSLVTVGPQPQHYSRTILARNVRIYLPKTHAGMNASFPLLVFLHENAGVGSGMAEKGFNALAERHQFVLAAPKSLLIGWDDPSERGFLDNLLDTLTAEYRIDTNRIFVAGYSNGAFMAYRYGLNTRKRIRGIGVVGGLMPSFDNGVRPAGPIALAVFHSTGDAVSPYYGGGSYLNVEQSVAKWMSYAQWETTFDTLLLHDPFPSNVNTVQKFTSKNKEVVFYKITGGSHAWPGPGVTAYRPTIPDVNATAELMDFFAGLRSGIIGHAADSPIPADASLMQNYPNPFNPATNLEYRVSTCEHVTLRVVDLLGREVALLVNEKKPPGTYSVTWHAGGLPSEMYLCTFTAGKFRETKKMILLK